jgi:anti-sigma regulatory factor (Ser/Thr protein kinase)
LRPSFGGPVPPRPRPAHPTPDGNGRTETVTPLLADRDAAGSARDLVAAHASALPAPLCSDAVLLVSELVTNAVLHGASPITLRLSATPGRIRVEVHDHGSSLPVPRQDRSVPARPGGLGLVLVKALASEWGVTQSPEHAGKTVWFEINVSANRGRDE